MAGRLGNKKVTIQNLKILNIDNENNLIILKGAVPGHKGSLIKIVDAVKKNQKISINDEANKDSLPENSQNNNTNVSENVTTITQETSENAKIQKNTESNNIKEDEKKNQLTADSKQTENHNN